MSIIPFSIRSRIKKIFGIICLIAGGIVIGYALAHAQTVTPRVVAQVGPPLSGGRPEAVLPNPQLTPGAIRIYDAATVCRVKWGADRRHVTARMKREVCAAYGMAASDCTGKNYEIDHLIPRELGGADDVKNLWPQPWPQARLKDRLENFLHQQVCDPAAPEGLLQIAQERIALNWFQAYQQYFGGSK